MDDRLALAPVDQLAHVRLGLALPVRQTRAAEGVDLVAFPASRKIAPIAGVVARTGVARHQHFGTIIELRNTRHGHQPCQVHLVQVQVFADHAVQPRDIVISLEQNQLPRIRVQVVERQRLIDIGKARTGILAGQRAAHRFGHREIHQAWQRTRIAVEVLFPALPARYHRRRLVPLFADHVQVWIFSHQAPRVFGQEGALGVAIGVDAQAGQPGVFDPPDIVLYQIGRHQRVGLVHVRHALAKPAGGEVLPVSPGTVWVLHRDPVMAGWDEFAAMVSPVRRRHVLHPPVAAADMRQHHILDDADAALARLRRQALEVGIAAVARIDAVMVGRRVAMVGVGGHVVLDQRSGPDLGEAHAGDVVEAVDHALDVAAVARAAARPIELVPHAGDAVVARVAVGKAVRHDLVDRVLAGKSLPGRRAGLARVQFVLVTGRSGAAAEADLKFSWPRGRTDLQVDEQVVLVGDPGDLVDPHARVVDRGGEFRDAFAVNHQLQRFGLHAGPPEGRLQVLDAVVLRLDTAAKQGAGGEQPERKTRFHGGVSYCHIGMRRHPFAAAACKAVVALQVPCSSKAYYRRKSGSTLREG